MTFLKQEEWVDDTKTHHYLAQVALEIHLFSMGMAGVKGQKSLKDFLLKPAEGVSEVKAEPRKYEVGEELVKEQKWAAVNAAAKAAWAARLGLARRDANVNGGTPGA